MISKTEYDRQFTKSVAFFISRILSKTDSYLKFMINVAS